MTFDFQKAFTEKLNSVPRSYAVSGMVGQDGTVYPLGSDTKVLSTIFELFTRPLMQELAAENGLMLIEPAAQNHYPDFTLCRGVGDKKKIAVDVKTTYIDRAGEKFCYTLGGYTSFIRPGNESKNIAFPFDEYAEHWVIGYVYERVAAKQAAQHATFKLSQIADIPLAYKNTRVFVQEKWRIASGSAGSGNTTNMGSINGHIGDFEAGKGHFKDEAEFLDYWRNYGRTAEERKNFTTVDEYRKWRATGIAQAVLKPKKSKQPTLDGL